MNKKQNISDKEANALIEQFMNGGNVIEPTKKTTESTKEKMVDIINNKPNSKKADDMIDKYFDNKADVAKKESINDITSKGAFAVTRAIVENRSSGDHKSNRILINSFDTRGTDASDFAVLLNQLIAYKAYDKIKLHVEYLVTDTKNGLEDLLYFVGRSINSYQYRSDEEKKLIISILRLK